MLVEFERTDTPKIALGKLCRITQELCQRNSRTFCDKPFRQIPTAADNVQRVAGLQQAVAQRRREEIRFRVDQLAALLMCASLFLAPSCSRRTYDLVIATGRARPSGA